LHPQIPGFTDFLAEGLEKPHFDVIFSSGIINLLFDGFTYNTGRHFAHCSYLSSPFPGSEKTTQLAKYPRALSVKPSNKRFIIPLEKITSTFGFFQSFGQKTCETWILQCNT